MNYDLPRYWWYLSQDVDVSSIKEYRKSVYKDYENALKVKNNNNFSDYDQDTKSFWKNYINTLLRFTKASLLVINWLEGHKDAIKPSKWPSDYEDLICEICGFGIDRCALAFQAKEDRSVTGSPLQN